MKKLYFTVDDLAERWKMSPSDIGALGADGLLQFGIYIDGMLHVEIGAYDDKTLEFNCEAVQLWKGFVPVNSVTVAGAWLHGETDYIGIPNTDCGKVVQVINNIHLSTSNLSSHRLLIAVEEVEKYEKKTKTVSQSEPESTISENVAPPGRWSRGLKKVAWECASSLYETSKTIHGPSLADVMGKSTQVEIRNNGQEMHWKGAEANLQRGELEVKRSTIEKDWAKQLRRLIAKS